jgi:hypothetical protein
MAIIGVILFGIFSFIFFGAFGKIIQVLGIVFDFLLDGCFRSLGCFAWIVIIFLLLVVLAL